MNDYIINTLYLNTNYKGITGATLGKLALGTPYIDNPNNQFEIIIPRDALYYKLHQLISLRDDFTGYTVSTLQDFDKKGESPESSVMIAYKEKLRDVFFRNERPSEVIGNNVRTFYPYSVQGFSSNDSVRDYVVSLTNEWIGLIEDIFSLKQGLARQILPDAPPPRPLEPVEITRQVISATPLVVNIDTYEVSITEALLSSSKTLIDLKTLQFFDEEREYKTILNFGDDKQYVIEHWRAVSSPTSSIQLKLTKPLKNDIDLYSSAYIVREFAQPVIDVFNVELPPPVDDSLVLRPANMDVGRFANNKQTIINQTIETLGGITGSLGLIESNNVSYDDRVFNRWYTADYNSSELNINFEDYNNFVFFGSAQARLDAFANKLAKIQSYDTTVSLNSADDVQRKNAIEREYIKRNFDGYEQYLYFASMSNAYSASAYYMDGGVEYNPTGSWPKDTNMNPLTYTSIQEWYTSQSAIAQRFDEFNPNYLVKHLPEYIQEDANSVDFIKFIQMFGHIMDNIKVYIDQFPNIYSTHPGPFSDLSMDQVYEVGKSFGMDLPNAYSVEALSTFIASLYDGVGTRALLAETWKRFLHSAVYLKQLKGSRTGVDTVINTFGINSPLVQVKESTYAVDGNYIKSDELVYALRFTGSLSSSIRLPLVSSSFTASTVQIRFIPELRRESSLLSTVNSWAIDLIPHPSSSPEIIFNDGTSRYVLESPAVKYGKINIVSGSSRTIIASSSYFPLFSDDYTHIMLRSQSRDMVIIQTDGDQILFQQSSSITGSVNWANLWNTNHVFLGASGSIKNGVFDGVIDDVRIWAEQVTTDNFVKQAYDPGAYYGSYYSSSYDNLLVDLSFSQPYASITQSATNESPFVSASKITNLPVTPVNSLTTESYVRILRTIKQFVPVVGGSIFSNKKITVAPPPTFVGNFVDSNGTKTLLPMDSIKPIREKQYVGGTDYVQFAVSPSDFVNQTILRSMGDIDTNYLIGSPIKFNAERYTELDSIYNFFLKNYNETINVNEYIRFFRNVLKAPSEYIQTYIPARSNLVDGIVIEPSILDRSKSYIQRSIRVDGSNTRIFENFVSSSGNSTSSSLAGAYDFLAEYIKEEPENTTIITRPVIQQIGLYEVTSSLLSDTGIGMVDSTINNITSEQLGSTTPYTDTTGNPYTSSKIFLQNIGVASVSSSLADSRGGIGMVDAILDYTELDLTGTEPYTSLPSSKRFLQKVGRYSVSSSISDTKTSVGSLEPGIITFTLNTDEVQTGYARKIYYGLTETVAGSSVNTNIYRIESEENTLLPFYEIKSATDLSEVGTTNFFYRNSGIYKLPRPDQEPSKMMLNKEQFLTKLDIPLGEIESLAGRNSYPITLLPTSSLTDYPGRSKLDIKTRTYQYATPYTGTLNIANIFSLYSIIGVAGLRLRLYANVTDQYNDRSRPFETLPAENSGVLFDALLTAEPSVFPYTLIQTENSTIYYTVTNETYVDINTPISLVYFEYQPAQLIPMGYLPRHYKFNRDNGIARKRRNYIGSKNIFCPTFKKLSRGGRFRPDLEGLPGICPPGITSDQSSPIIPYTASSAAAPTTQPRRGGGTNPRGPLK